MNKRIHIFYLFLILSAGVAPLTEAAAQQPAVPNLRVGTTAAVSEQPVLKGVQTVRIAAIRAQFQPDDNYLTTGDGTFDLSDNPDTLIVDPPPHNRSYFSDQLEALKRYYGRVSNGKLTLEYEVFPAGENDAYTLPEEMVYYNPNTTEEELDIRLSQLLEEAVSAADADIDFSLFDAVIVFHAGVGSDFLLEDAVFDPTPNDIPSVHLDLDHLASTIGGAGYEGIPVDGGMRYVKSGTILPETETKRDVEIGLLGILAHQFGHELGMPSLFNTSNGRPAIGKWGLMGVGFANINGVLPAEPCAWTKVFMEWEEPFPINEVTHGIHGPDFSVYASQEETGYRIYKISISPSEYFLIENRLRDFAGDGLNIVKSSTTGVLLEADDYDYDIPGTGLLIWHVDQKVILDNLTTNSINADPDNRGVDLEEADGSQDIGELFPGILPGFPSPENGIPTDAFYAGNNDEFTPSTVPNSWSNARGNSHISVTAISDTGQVMSFSVGLQFTIDNEIFPKTLSYDLNGLVPIWLQPAVPDSLKIIIFSADGEVFRLLGSNQAPPRMPARYGSLLDGVAVTAQPVAGGLNFPEYSFRNRIYVSDSTGMLSVFDVSSTELNRLYFISLPAASHMLLADYLYMSTEEKVLVVNADGSLHAETLPLGGMVTGLAGMFTQSGAAVYATLTDGTVMLIDSDGTPTHVGMSVGSESAVSILSDLDNDGSVELFTAGSNGGLSILGAETYTNSVDAEFVFEPVAGDIDGDGFREVIVAAQSETMQPAFQLYAFERNGSLVEGYPVSVFEFGYPDRITTNLILGDVTGDGRQNILFGTDRGNLFALNERGEPVEDFPLPAADGLTGTPLLLRSAAADRMELAAFDDAGYFYLWDLERTYDDKMLAWPAYGNGNAHLRFSAEQLAPVVQPVQERLMPPEKVFNWPNPNTENWTRIRYYLNYEADVRIKIFTQVGDLVAELTGPGMAMADNEVVWNLDSVESGVYYAEVSATGNNMTDRKVIKIAVIK